MPRPRPSANYPFQTPGGFISQWLVNQGFGPEQAFMFTVEAYVDPDKLNAHPVDGSIIATPVGNVKLCRAVPKADEGFVYYYEGIIDRDRRDTSIGTVARGTTVRVIIVRNIKVTANEPDFHGLMQLCDVRTPNVIRINNPDA